MLRIYSIIKTADKEIEYGWSVDDGPIIYSLQFPLLEYVGSCDAIFTAWNLLPLI